ncbi:DUF4249 domain-containing protein [Paraflavitalea sp. CAU 1676]|uniref:DUF4249 domain-containing protein n=1 Tax=Paraflavitalea sp. CAU 1676 TaxID=3032598 RepID=UPI0023D982FD|nr:DUF4249 domain-containing protein [Paraflavitalea sp. CAU 1676]MDF2187175.1 DUF4249 domain-containing protein [Paraflavitalea sp. CAU 1676]
MKKLFYSCLVLLTLGCKQRFDPPVTAPPNGYLVVDGIINSGGGPTNIRLSRAISLSDTSRIKYERNAVVRVEGDNNSFYVLPESSQGLYSAAGLPLANNVKYRLYVRTTEGKEYTSDYTTAIKTPAIDDIRWEQPEDLQLYINTHDPQNKTRYYRWEWEETWEFHSAYTTTLKYLRNSFGEITGIDYLYPNMMYDTMNYICWKTEYSTNLLIGSSAKLSKDSIDLPIHFIPHASEKVSQLYSILVRQYALSKAGYEFLQKMKKNTEQTGTLFDAQPSELKGNIHANSNPNEIVIGYVEVCDMQEKRIFIKPSDLLAWGYRTGCMELKVPNNVDSIRAYSYLHPTNVAELTPRGDIASFYAADVSCVLCTQRGVHIKPPFWPR